MNPELDCRPLEDQLGLSRSRDGAGTLRLLFFTHYFPPEGNAPASRTYEMCKRWVRAGHRVTVVTCAPNAPDGVLYPGYRNRLVQSEMMDGIRVLRVWTLIAPNRGKYRRGLNFVSYLVMATLAGWFTERPDAVIATSPQFFCAWAGVLVRRFKRIPFILEVRDIWPESITAVGAVPANPLIRLLESMERQMYDSAGRIVTVGNGYKRQLEARGVAPERISVITNGVDRELFNPQQQDRDLVSRYGLEGKFVVAYVGTIGMASGLSVVLRAGKLLREQGRDDIRLLLVGAGAVREELELEAARLGLTNVVFTGKIDKSRIPSLLASVDACLVHLKKKPLFESVLPSKIFEAAGMRKPIILGVQGSAAELVTAAGAGICIEPEDEHQLLAAIDRLKNDPAMARSLGQSGHDYVHRHFDRDTLSNQYLDVIRTVISSGVAKREKRNW